MAQKPKRPARRNQARAQRQSINEIVGQVPGPSPSKKETPAAFVRRRMAEMDAESKSARANQKKKKPKS